MNLDDRFAQLIVRPHVAVSVRADVHRLRLAEAADRWYAGSGATRRTGTIFGYAGRMSGGRTSLGTVLEAAADWTVSRHWRSTPTPAESWAGMWCGRALPGIG